MKFLSRLLTTALGATLLVSSAAHARTVVIGHVNLSFHEATAAVFQNVLERSGYNVAMKKGSHSVMYPLLAEGEFDLFDFECFKEFWGSFKFWFSTFFPFA